MVTATVPGRGSGSRAADASSSVSPPRYAVVVAGLLRTLGFPAVYYNMHETLVSSLNADVYLAISAEDENTSSAAVEHQLRGALSVLRPIDWRVVPASLAREATGAWAARGCGSQRVSWVSQWLTVAQGYSLVRAHEDAKGMRYDVIVRTRSDLVMEHVISRDLVQFATMVPWRVWTFCVDIGTDLGAIGTDADFHTRTMSAYTSAVVCPGQDGFAIMPRTASDAYFRTVDQFDCTSSFSRRKVCRRNVTAGHELDSDCLAVGRRWCRLSANCCDPDSCECRLSQQLRENALCVCQPLTNRPIRSWKTGVVSSDESTHRSVWILDSRGQVPYKPLQGAAWFKSPLPRLDLNGTNSGPPLHGPKCCYTNERPSAASRASVGFTNFLQ